MSIVSIERCEDYEIENVYKVLKDIIENSDMPKVKNKTILLKPNILSDSKPEACITTHPAVLTALIRLLKEMDAKKILVGDSPGLHSPKFKPKKSKIYQVCKDEDVEWVNFHKKTKKKKIPFIDRKIAVTKTLDEVDFCISVAKFKTHELMTTTGAIKNMFGLVPGLNKSKQHVHNPTKKGFAKMICGLFSVSKTEFAIMDAIVGMEGAGPGNGDPKKVGLLMASNDALALDISQAIIMGHNPLDIPIIKYAIKKRLTETTKIDEITYSKLNANDLIIKDYKRIGKDTVPTQRPAPTFIADRCIRCKKCIKICPANALTLQKKKIVIDEEKCVRCYCCHEVCPAKAIKIK
ncbi:MAG: DUF362 domain-containing protein [Sphaerochaetaceae bacterium]|nr:DUF362 domain-containing protein [Sphaerochaetaceae bacterium]MDC7236369.1 DUF362 domain-containing protein [Sphaerochaetaceae bacterium]MDC7250953.1 DUF362 domain-containing protein [Sphaerochaetaceae bacterium]